MRLLAATALLLLGFTAGFAITRAPGQGAAPHAAPAPSVPAGEPLGERPLTERLVTAPLALALAEARARPARRYQPDEEASRSLARARATLGASGVDLENPCLPGLGVPCARPLDAIFARLDAVDAGAARARVLVLGNSLIAADHITDVVRARLAGRFGDGGRGLLLAERISEYGTRRRTGTGAGFDAHYLSQGEPGAHPFGLSGTNHVAARAGARTRFSLEGEAAAQIFLHHHRAAPRARVVVDGEELALLEPTAPGPAVVDVALPPGARELVLVADGPGLVVQGVVLEKQAKGAVLDTVGLPAADSPRWLTADEGSVHAQLAARDPSLLMVMLGGVENRRIAWRRYDDEHVRASLAALLARLRRGAPEASCLVVGPIDAVYGMLDERVLGVQRPPFTERPELARMIALEREVALGSGCGFFDLYAAMGGAGSLARFDRHGLLHDDDVHPRGFGLDVLGELLADALLREWERHGDEAARASLLQQLARAEAPGLPALELARHDRPQWRVGVVEAAAEGFGARLQDGFALARGEAEAGLDGEGRLTRRGVVVTEFMPRERFDLVVVAPGGQLRGGLMPKTPCLALTSEGRAPSGCQELLVDATGEPAADALVGLLASRLALPLGEGPLHGVPR